MLCGSLRELENKVAAIPDDVEARLSLARRLMRDCREDEARGHYQHALQHPTVNPNSNLYIPARDGFITSGGPWVTHADETFTVYNVRMLGPEEKPELWNLRFDREFWRTKKKQFFYWGEADIELRKELKKKDREIATAGELANAMFTIDDLEQFGIQSEESGRARQDLRQILGGLPVTCTRMRYGRHVIDRNGRADQYEIPGEIGGDQDYLRNLSDGTMLARTLLRTDRSVKDIDRIVNRFLDIEDGAFMYRMPAVVTSTTDVVLGLLSGHSRFSIGTPDRFYDDGRIALVVPERVR